MKSSTYKIKNYSIILLQYKLLIILLSYRPVRAGGPGGLFRLSARASPPLVIKHQLQLNNLFLKRTLGDNIESGPSKKIISNTDIKKKKEFMEIDSFESLKQCTWICIKGTKYQSKMVLTLDINENNLPKFGIIDDIYICYNKVIIFQCLSVKTIIFYEHYFSFEIKHENSLVFAYHHMLYSHIPNNISVMPNGCTYVTLSSSI